MANVVLRKKKSLALEYNSQVTERWLSGYKHLLNWKEHLSSDPAPCEKPGMVTHVPGLHTVGAGQEDH